MSHPPHPLEYQSPRPDARPRPRRRIFLACVAAVLCVAMAAVQWRMRLWSSSVTNAHFLLSLYGMVMVIACEWSGALSKRDRVIVLTSAAVCILSAAWCLLWPIFEPAY